MTFDQFKSRWSGVVAGHRVFDVALQLDAVLESQSDSRGGSLPFMGLASDGEIYWIKPPSNRQSSRVPTTAGGDGLDNNELERLAARLESLTIEEIAGVVRMIPAAWPVTDNELEMVAAFFDFRREPTAARLRGLAKRIQSD